MSELERDPPFPIELGPVSNGEYAPRPITPFAKEVQRRTLADAERHARALGIDRRRFLIGLGGAATMLTALAACSDDRARSGGEEVGGTFSIPDTAPLEPETSAEALVGEPDAPADFVFDVQTHFLDHSRVDSDTTFGLDFPQAQCGRDPATACFGIDVWAQEVFGNSETSMAVISALPILADPHPQDHPRMAEARDAIDELCGEDRVILHGQANPNVGDLGERLEGMRDIVGTYDIAAWKVYTHVGAPPWSLDDHDAEGAQVGRAFLEQVGEIGPPIVCAHKGLGSPRWASPIDIGPAARDFPEIAFIVYHSGFELDVREGPYQPDARHRGIDRLIDTVTANELGAGDNVYAELGSTWFRVMQDPDAAAHTIGKLLRFLGEDNIVWGTDSIWYGSPQSQIDAFRAFEITPEYQERFGYPPLTDDAKRKILGTNAADLYGTEPVTLPCRPSAEEIDELRVAAGPPRTYGPRTFHEAAALFDEHARRL